jgi:hypothetical protein
LIEPVVDEIDATQQWVIQKEKVLLTVPTMIQRAVVVIALSPHPQDMRRRRTPKFSKQQFTFTLGNDVIK